MYTRTSPVEGEGVEGVDGVTLFLEQLYVVQISKKRRAKGNLIV
jgi:hypothetical protein